MPLPKYVSNCFIEKLYVNSDNLKISDPTASSAIIKVTVDMFEEHFKTEAVVVPGFH